MSGLDAQRSYIISNVRGNAPAIFDLDAKPGVYAPAYDRSRVPEMFALLHNPKKPTENYPRYCAALYKDGIVAGGNLFGSTIILNVSRPTLFFTTHNS